MYDISTILAELAAIIVLARTTGWLFTKVGQPAVVGEITAGILLGPSILGTDLSETLFPLDTRPYLAVLASLGLVLFMFVVGLELDTSPGQGRGRVAGSVSVASILLPFSSVSASRTSPRRPSAVRRRFWPFALFIGAAMSITAFPVLARILTDRKMHRTETGGIALACAATDDVLAWTLLAVVIAHRRRRGGGARLAGLPGDPVRAVRAAAWCARSSPASPAAYAAGGSADAGDPVGRPGRAAALRGGHRVPRTCTTSSARSCSARSCRTSGAAALRHEILIRLEQISVLLLLPVFFLVSGLKVNIRGLSARATWSSWSRSSRSRSAASTSVRTSAPAPPACRTGRPTSLGILMNTRGLTELVILNVGRELGLIGDDAVHDDGGDGPGHHRHDRAAARLGLPEAPGRPRHRRGGAGRARRRGGATGRWWSARPGRDSQTLVERRGRLLAAHPARGDRGRRPGSRRAGKLEMGSGLTDELAEMAAAMERQQVLVDGRRGRRHPGPGHRQPERRPRRATWRSSAEVLAPQYLVVVGRRPGGAGGRPPPPTARSSQVATGHGARRRTARGRRGSADSDSDAAVVVACRIAGRSGAPLELRADGGTRRLQAMLDALVARGVATLRGRRGVRWSISGVDGQAPPPRASRSSTPPRSTGRDRRARRGAGDSPSLGAAELAGLDMPGPTSSRSVARRLDAALAAAADVALQRRRRGC